MSVSIVEKIAKLIAPEVFAMSGDHAEGKCEYCDDNRKLYREKAKQIVKALTIEDLEAIIKQKKLFEFATKEFE